MLLFCTDFFRDVNNSTKDLAFWQLNITLLFPDVEKKFPKLYGEYLNSLLKDVKRNYENTRRRRQHDIRKIVKTVWRRLEPDERMSSVSAKYRTAVKKKYPQLRQRFPLLCTNFVESVLQEIKTKYQKQQELKRKIGLDQQDEILHAGVLFKDPWREKGRHPCVMLSKWRKRFFVLYKTPSSSVTDSRPWDFTLAWYVPDDETNPLQRKGFVTFGTIKGAEPEMYEQRERLSRRTNRVSPLLCVHLDELNKHFRLESDQKTKHGRVKDLQQWEQEFKKLTEYAALARVRRHMQRTVEV